ncbi:MAG: YdiU family protein [Granulosicoccus sp.]
MSGKDAAIAFDNSYVGLPEHFYAKVAPTRVAQPGLIAFNTELARQLGIDADHLTSAEGLQILAGNELAAGSEPLAMAYAGHQFGNWVPQLGDGRAILLGEVHGLDGERYDIQLKGAGRTPFSRGGDGRNWIGPVMREYLISEAMAAMGVPTTRALAAVTTGEHILRESGPMPGAIITRVARSHIRVGTFQFFTAREDESAVKTLIDYVINRHYPEIASAENTAHAMLDAVIKRQAELIAHWQSLGFIHGVMNTDNSSITGDTIDYGPCAFMDTFQADKVFSSIDQGGRYAYQNQPRLAHWNLANLAQCLLPFMHDEPEKAVELAQESINRFDELFISQYLTQMRAKLGLGEEQADDLELASSLLHLMEEHKLDFTMTFRQLTIRSATDPFAPGGALYDWHLRWQQHLANSQQSEEAAVAIMKQHNPVLIPRNHQVEAVIESGVKDADFTSFNRLLKAVTSPYNPQYEDSEYTQPPTEDQVVTQTFCGT